MKKLILLSCIVSMFLLSACGMNLVEESIISNYEVDNSSDYIISSYTNLGFKLVDLNPDDTIVDNVYFLGYLVDDTLEIDIENKYIKSLHIGKTCISITSTVLEVGRGLNHSIMVDLLGTLNEKLNSEENKVTMVENLEAGKPYIISKDDTYVYIDYISSIPDKYDSVMYYRIILQDITMLDTEITDDQIELLSDSLPELLNVLGINESIELPVNK